MNDDYAILIFDDARRRTAAAAAILNECGCRLQTAGGEDDFSEVIDRAAPDLIICGSGELYQAVRANAPSDEIPVLLIAAADSAADDVKPPFAPPADAADFLDIAISPARIIAKIVRRVERARAEKLLRGSKDQFKTLFQGIAVPTYVWKKTGADFIFTDYNAAAENTGDHLIKNLVGTRASEAFAEYPALWQAINESFDTKKSVHLDTPYFMKRTGELKQFYMSYVYMPPDTVMAYARDTSEHKQAVEDLQISKTRFQLIARATNDILWDWDLSTDVLWWSESYYSVLGHRDGDVEQGLETFLNGIHPDDRERIAESTSRTIDAGENYWSADYRYRRADGSFADIFDRAYVLRDDDGKPLRMIGAMMDISRRKQSEAALSFQKKLLEAQSEASIDGILVVSANGEVISHNRRFREIWELSAESLTAQSSAALLEKYLVKVADSEKFTKLIEYVERHPQERQSDEVIFKNGSVYERYTAPITDAADKYYGRVWFFHDITQRRKREQAIRFQAHLLNTVEQAVIATNLNGTVLYWNSFAEKLYGWTAPEALNQSIVELTTPAVSREQSAVIMKLLGQGKSWSGEFTVHRRGGEMFPVQITNSPIYDDAGKLVGILGISNDITERKNAAEALQKSEVRLQQSQKLESVGRLAGGIAHDFNNMLTAINGYSDLILKNLDGDESLQQKVLEIKKAGERSATLTQQLLAFSRQQILQPKLIDLNTIVSDMSRMLNRLIGENLELEIKLHAGECELQADPGQLSQVVMNLIVNARDAMPNGGRLTIKTDIVDLDEEFAAKHEPTQPGRYVCLTVADSGTGIEDETLQHIFEPFYTTKEIGQGTGLGLATVYGIVKQSGGYIWVESEVGAGSTFNVYLPAVSRRDKPSAAAATTNLLLSGSETVLLVEDEKMVRSLTSQILEMCGYTVIEAADGIEALEICEKSAPKLDLLLTDIVMPRMGGRELAKKLTEKYRSICVLFTSGYTNDDAVLRDIEPATNFIQKPYTPDALAGIVRKILDQKSKH